MPYIIRKVGDKWKIIRKSNGTVAGTSDSKQKAEASVRARMAGEYGKK